MPRYKNYHVSFRFPLVFQSYSHSILDSSTAHCHNNSLSLPAFPPPSPACYETRPIVEIKIPTGGEKIGNTTLLITKLWYALARRKCKGGKESGGRNSFFSRFVVFPPVYIYIFFSSLLLSPRSHLLSYCIARPRSDSLPNGYISRSQTQRK